MKTNEFIKLLQEEDPNNECDVCVGNHPVHWIEKLPYYYDGRQEKVERENGIPVRGGYPSGTIKLKIHYDTLEDALLDNPEMELDLSGITYQGKVDSYRKEFIDQWIADGRKFQECKKKLEEAHKNGTEPPSICDPITFKTKLGNWLRKVGVIE